MGNVRLENTTRRDFLIAAIVLGAVAAFALSGYGQQPQSFPPDKDYELPENAKFLPPQKQNMLFDLLSRINPVDYNPNDEAVYKESKKYTKKAATWYIRAHVGRDKEIEICSNNAIAAINLNYPKYKEDRDEKIMSPVQVLADIVNWDYSDDRMRHKREFTELANVHGINSENIDNLLAAENIRGRAYIWLVRALVYQRVAEFNEKFNEDYENSLFFFQHWWKGYLEFLKKVLTTGSKNIIREGSYEKTIARIDEIFENIRPTSVRKEYKELELHSRTTEELSQERLKYGIKTEEERREKIRYVLDGLNHEKTNAWQNVYVYDDLANLMGGLNFMTEDPFLNQIMIFSVRKYIFEKAAKRFPDKSFVNKTLLKEVEEAEYIVSHYKFLYEAENKKPPEFWQRVK